MTNEIIVGIGTIMVFYGLYLLTGKGKDLKKLQKPRIVFFKVHK